MPNTERGAANSNEEERATNLPISDAEVADEDDESAMIAEVLGTDAAEDLRPEARQQIARFFTSITSVGITGFNPILRTITPEHLSKMLDNRERSDERAHASEASERRYRFLYFLIGLPVVVALLVFFTMRGDIAILINVIVALMSFLGGFGIGSRGGGRRR